MRQIILTRFEDWPERLAAFIAARRDMPFTWGAQDCCLFAADAAVAITGHDFAAELRGTYATETEADDLLRQHGGIEQLVDATGLQRVPPAFVQRGDVVLMVYKNDPALGVVVGNSVAHPGMDGLIYLPFDHAMIAWAV